MTLWIFGHSVCLPYNLTHEQDGWPHILAQNLGAKLENFSQLAADNFYIYASFQQNVNQINQNDIVIVGWSHPSRKSFVLDRQNPNHLDVLDQSLIYTLQNCELMRSLNKTPSASSHWQKLKPRNTGKKFYDTWFTDYYSEYEQALNLQSYHESVKFSCQGQYIPFFFSQDSVKDINVSGVGYILEFIHDNRVAISNTDMHLNNKGHKLWAEHLNKAITVCN